MRSGATDEIVDHLFVLVERLKAAYEATVAQFELSPPQAKALRYVAVSGPVAMRDVATGLRCDSSNVTGIIDRLEARGLIERRIGAVDRRVKTLVVTPAGGRLAELMWARICDAVPLDGLTDSDRKALVDLLRRLDHP